jgi:hypothetical protein
MRAVDGEDLKLLAGYMTHPAGYFASFSIPGRCDWVPITHQACLPFRELAHGAERDPGVIAGTLLKSWAQKIAQNRHSQHGAHGSIQKNGQLEEKGAS